MLAREGNGCNRILVGNTGKKLTFIARQDREYAGAHTTLQCRVVGYQALMATVRGT